MWQFLGRLSQLRIAASPVSAARVVTVFVLPNGSCKVAWWQDGQCNDQAVLPSVGGCGVDLVLCVQGYFVKSKRNLGSAAEGVAAVSTPMSTPPEPHHAKVSMSY